MADDRDPKDVAAAVGDGARPLGAIAVVVVALVAAVVLPDAPVGIGVSLVAIGIAGAVWLTAPGLRLSGSDRLLVALGLALAVVPAVRSAEWIVALCVLAGMGLSAVIVTKAVRAVDVFASPLAVLRRLPGAFGFLARPFGRSGVPSRLAPALRGAGIAALLLGVFGALFTSADRAFARLAGDLLIPDWDLGTLPARLMVFAMVGLAAGALARTAVVRAGAALSVGIAPPVRRLGLTEWMIALGALDALFAAFVLVQVAVLFGGRDHVLTTSGLSYAEYARQGFFQLLAVGALTLGVVAAAVRWARRETGRETRWLQVVLGVLCLLTLVVLASAFRRLSLYESVFGFTRLRLSVHATILWMVAVFSLVLVAGVRMRGAWLPRVLVALTAGGLVSFAALNPDRYIAERNVERFVATGAIDLAYLSSLSADAVPALAALPPDLARCAMWPHAHLRAKPLWGASGHDAQLEEQHLLGWNYGRRAAAPFVPPRQPAASSIACADAVELGLWP